MVAVVELILQLTKFVAPLLLARQEMAGAPLLISVVKTNSFTKRKELLICSSPHLLLQFVAAHSLTCLKSSYFFVEIKVD